MSNGTARHFGGEFLLHHGPGSSSRGRTLSAMTDPAKREHAAALLAITLLLVACDSAGPEPVEPTPEIIIPADDVSGSAIEAGAPEFIDLIAANNELFATRLVGGIAWLDRAIEKKSGKNFLDSSIPEQTAMLDQIAFKEKATPENQPGVVFFSWMRRLTADAFYTSPIGVKDIGYLGNKGMTKFEVPAAAIQYAVKRSGLA